MMIARMVKPPGAGKGRARQALSLPAGFTPIPALLSLFGSGPVLDAAGAPHPWQWPDGAHPVGERGDETEVLFDVLLADPAGRNHLAARQGERRAEDGLQHEDAFGVMPQRAVPEIRRD